MMDSTKGTMKGPAQPPLHPADFTSSSSEDTLDIVLLAGQSNMKGRATIPMEPQENSNLLFLHSRELSWYVARDPLHALGVPDLIDGDDNAGTGPGMSFGLHLLEANPQQRVGLIPAAVGGAPIDSLRPESELYHRSLMLIKKATELSPIPTRLKAILWLQGEGDTVKERYQSYESKLLNLVDRYRSDLNSPQLPFIACTIGRFLVNRDQCQYGKEINDILLAAPSKREHVYCVDARDLTGHIGDEVHYDYESQLELGRRYAEVYRTLVTP